MSQRFGILIGINDYLINPLDYCVNDVNKIEEVLIKNCQFDTNNLRIITSDNGSSNKDIESLFYNAVDNISRDFRQNEDSIFFFFSGHGVHHEEATLLFHSKEITVSQIYAKIKDKLNPKNQFLVFDACHSGEKIKSAVDEDFFKELDWNKLSSKSENKTIIAASRFDQKATEKKIFQNGTLTHYFLKAIITKQNYNDLGFITPSVIADYVRREVSLDKNFNQIPYTNSIDIGSYPFAFSKYLEIGYKPLEITEIKREETNKEKNVNEKTIIRTAPTVFFIEKLSKAFPGIRGLKWFVGKPATDGLKRFLLGPLRFDEAKDYGVFADPIWWFRGGSALPVAKFEDLGNDKILLNNDELIIDKIAVFNSSSYYSSFIYIQVTADVPSGASEISSEDIERQVKSMGYCYESFGIYKDHVVTSEEYEDGAAIINGEYTELTDCKFRHRYLSKYNIILVPKSSPHNTREGNLLGTEYMNSILKEERTIEQFAKEYELLPRNHMDQ
ncbi:caspase family protein [Flavobacterium sp. F-65]|uniref:Caspase family protein n=1 Tax=Flavobacterium pisciphilum TaxID=2893755 RepID=A0ABS8MXQ0_9FLAO|nr:caspase family protein [Flavobacterium sp. F-65]MCC9073550.1 caspase family protein [Flavobacterium sp. F-65]